MVYGDLQQDMFQQVTEFLLGTEKYRKELNATRKIQRWWKKYKKYNNDNWRKSDFIRLVMKEYNMEQILRYPTFSTNKIRLYSSKVIDPLPEFNKKSQVRNWIIKTLNVSDIDLVGF